LTLATDLDGTFAGGPRSARDRLQRLLAARSGGLLIYVTGRSVPAARALMAEAGLPHPDVLIADVGTTVVDGRSFAPIGAIEAELAGRWPGGDAVRARLAGYPAVVEQSVRAPRRVSYERVNGEFEAVVSGVRDRLAGLDVHVIGSAGVYVDVLPRGIDKGTTLRRVLRWLGRPEAHVVVAGDTLNDLALFETGLRGIAVGNSEPALVARIRQRKGVFLATGPGAQGILEGLAHFGWIDEGVEVGDGE